MSKITDEQAKAMLEQIRKSYQQGSDFSQPLRALNAALNGKRKQEKTQS